MNDTAPGSGGYGDQTYRIVLSIITHDTLEQSITYVDLIGKVFASRFPDKLMIRSSQSKHHSA
ncbi:MAG: hypothetical protein ACREJM_08835, partial [Candidatus Saccharimonadales bacterium]